MNKAKTLSSKEESASSLPFVHAVDRGLAVAVRVMNVGGQAAGAVFERIGIFLAESLDAFGNILTGIPGGGSILHGMFHWLGTTIYAAFDLVAILICSLANLLADGTAG